MGNFFNPGDAKYRRKVQVFSFYACSLVAAHALMMDYGKQEHLFSPIQRYIIKNMDAMYEIKPEEIEKAIEEAKIKKLEASKVQNKEGVSGAPAKKS